MTFNEIRREVGMQSVEETFPREFEYLGNILGSLINNPSMKSVLLFEIEIKLGMLENIEPELFTPEKAGLLVKNIQGMAVRDNALYNDLLVALIRGFVERCDGMTLPS